MKKRGIVISLICVIVALCGGIFLGASYSDSSLAPTHSGVDQKKEGKQTTIAVVNQDQGAQYGNQILNYSTAFIDSMETDADFEVVSAKAAEKGMEDGTYGGVLVFPAELSQKVLSVNSENPEQIQLAYEINENLEKESFATVYDHIFTANVDFNNSLSYGFINSVFQQVHIGQYNIEELFANDKADVAAAQALSMTNFTSGLDFSAMTEETLDLKTVDIAKYPDLSESSTFSDDVVKLYNDACMSAYGTIYSSNTADINAATSGLVADADNTKAFNDAVTSDYEKLVAFYQEVKAYHADPTKPEPNLAQLEKDLKLANKKDTDEPLATYNKISTSLNQNKTKLNTAVANLETDKVRTDINTAVSGDGSEMVKRLDEFNKQLDEYRKAVESTQTNNEQQLNTAFTKYNLQRSELQTKAMEEYTKSAATLTEAVAKFVEIKATNSTENQDYLKSISSMMPYSKKDGVINKGMVEFISSPIVLVQQSL